jgi:hypothetical protein
MEELEIFPILAMLPNIEPDCLKLEDLALETQIRLLEAFKSIKDCEKGKIRGRGFSNASKINAGRNPSVFTDAELKAKEIFDSFELSYVHEARISLKDAQNRPHHFKLDFLFPDCRIDLEISPEFHKTYKLVVKRDLLRERLLKKAGIRQMTISAPCKKLNGTVKCLPDVNELRNFARMVKAAQKSPECLTYYLKDVNGRVPMEEIKNSLSFQSKSLTELFQMKKEAQNMSIDEKVAYFAAIRRKCSIIQSWKRKMSFKLSLKR